MRWEDLPESQNVEDRRDENGGGFDGGSFGGGGRFGGIPGGAGGLSIGAILVIGLIGWATGIDPSLLIGGAEMLSRNPPHTQPQQQRRTGTPTDRTGRFVARVLGSTEAVWKDEFASSGARYRAPVLVLYRGVTDARCGSRAMAAMGPFYCPVDRKIYLDTSFFTLIERRFRGCDAGSPSCQFAQAYVIAHEVGHHVQNLRGILARAGQAQRASGGQAQANRIQVRVELQADCFAGLWAKRSDQKWNLLQPGDIEAALRTASAIGDDTLQRQARGRVVPDSFTHGTSVQRQRWFSNGFQQGTVAGCNTFAAAAQL
jgi:uncharacterized protein